MPRSLSRGFAKGRVRPVDADAVAEMLVSAAIGMVEQEFAVGKPRSVDEAVESLLGVFLYGVVARESHSA